MAIQSSFYTPDGSTRTFPSTKHIASKQHMAVWYRRISDGVWVVQNVATYELINNTAVLVEAPSVTLYDNIEIRVVDSYDELVSSPSEVSIVAGIASEIAVVAAIDTDVVVVSGVASDIPTVAGDTLAINDITTEPLRTAVLNAGANASSAATSAAEAAASAASINPANLLHTVGTGAGNPEGYTTGEADIAFLAKASNLSDVADAPTALTNIGAVAKAGDTMTGQLKGITPIAPEDLTRKDYVDGLAIGVGQTWQDLTASRSSGVTYTNTTGRPIQIIAQNNDAVDSSVSLTVNGVLICTCGGGGATARLYVTGIIPNGATYVAVSSNAVFEKWSELR